MTEPEDFRADWEYVKEYGYENDWDVVFERLLSALEAERAENEKHRELNYQLMRMKPSTWTDTQEINRLKAQLEAERAKNEELDWVKLMKDMDDLHLQLAEKDKEIEHWKKLSHEDYWTQVNKLSKEIEEKDKEIMSLRRSLEYNDQLLRFGEFRGFPENLKEENEK